MGVRRLFSRGGQNFPGGVKTYYWPKKCLKTYYYHSKKSKNILFRPARGGGKCPLLPSPADAYDSSSCFLFINMGFKDYNYSPRAQLERIPEKFHLFVYLAFVAHLFLLYPIVIDSQRKKNSLDSYTIKHL